jgi:hypothetical protein
MLLLLACTGTGDDTGGSDTAPLVVTTWYLGTSDGQTPDGTYVAPTAELLFIRTLDPGAGTITEEYWQEDSPAWQHGFLTHTVDAAAGTFSATWDTGEGVLAVDGAFDAGAAWAWTAWHSLSTYTDGKYVDWTVTSLDSVDDAGTDTALKSVVDPDGNDTWDIVEVIAPTDQASFEARLAEIEG